MLGSKLPYYFLMMGDGHQPIVGVYIPIIRIAIKGRMDHPQHKEVRRLDSGTCVLLCFLV